MSNEQSLTKDVYKEFLEGQFLILWFVQEKLDVFNYISDGYEDHKPILVNNSFLFFTAQVFSRSIIVELAALFSDRNTNKSNFHKIYKAEENKNQIKPDACEKIKIILADCASDIKTIERLRDKEYSHFDFADKSGISLHFDHYDLMNKLYLVGKRILTIASTQRINPEKNFGFAFDTVKDSVESLHWLIETHSSNK